ncbi:MAG: hypothetical protein IKU15_06145 [Clostridia bacterium]|nr:hypothetical protein [Clostridia bacterium]
MNEDTYPFWYECDEGECTVYYEKPYPVNPTKESCHLVIMEIGYKSEYSVDCYYLTKEEAIAMAKKVCAELKNRT